MSDRVTPANSLAGNFFIEAAALYHRQGCRKAMKIRKSIALVAHDNRKQDLLDWVEWNRERISEHRIIATGTTGRLIRDLLAADNPGAGELQIQLLKSGPLGGDQQLGAIIAEGRVDMLVFLWDPMLPQPHDVDIKALLRLSVLYNVPTACNRSTADFLISSELFDSEYLPEQPDHSQYLTRVLPMKTTTI